MTWMRSPLSLDEARRPRPRARTADATTRAFRAARLVIGVLLCLASGVTTTACNRNIPMARSVDNVVRDLSRQLASGPEGARRRLVVDPMLDRSTGQQTEGAKVLEKLLTEKLAVRLEDVEIVPFDAETASQAELLLTGSLTALPKRGNYRMSVALTDTKSGIVVAQAAGYFRDEELDVSPTAFYRDSPSLVRDRSIEGYLRTAETDKGDAADALYIEQVPTSALLADALDLYNDGKVRRALELYSIAAERKDGQQLRTFNGLYLCNVRLGKMRAAGEAFDKIVALGLATGNLSIKLLFRPGSTEFWPDPKISGVYPLWLRHIAHAARDSRACLHVVGHTSRTGSEATNDQLSLERAVVIKNRLARDARGLESRLRVSGLGFRENIVGTGTDDATDAVDRRVEFRVEPCADRGGESARSPGADDARPAGAATTGGGGGAVTGAASSAAASTPAGCDLRQTAWNELASLPGHGTLLRSESATDRQESIDGVAYADLDGNGSDEAYVVVAAGYGANGGDVSLYVYESGERCTLRLLDSREGLSGGLLSVDVQVTTDRVVIETPVLKEGDARCCPSGSQREELTLMGGKLTPAP